MSQLIISSLLYRLSDDFLQSFVPEDNGSFVPKTVDRLFQKPMIYSLLPFCFFCFYLLLFLSHCFLRMCIGIEGMAWSIGMILIRRTVRKGQSSFKFKSIAAKNFIEFSRELFTKEPVYDRIDAAIEPRQGLGIA